MPCARWHDEEHAPDMLVPGCRLDRLNNPHPSLAAEVKVLAQEIAGEGANDQMQELATRIAEAQIELLRVRRARDELISRVRLEPDDETLVQEILPSDWDKEVQRLWGCAKPMPRSLKRLVEKTIMQEEFGPTLSDCAAGLAAMDRYEKRALSRRKFAIREFDTARKALGWILSQQR